VSSTNVFTTKTSQREEATHNIVVVFSGSRVRNSIYAQYIIHTSSDVLCTCRMGPHI
jgi:hypothetical protein